ncbi:MAG: hypothetical protein M3R06_01575 [Chloroflexota bacterium]|nr:hypothetical protein [Chloroflexota bacterium]
MSEWTRGSLHPVRGLAIALLAAIALAGGSSPAVLAQDASPAASPAAEMAPCDAPELPPGTPTPFEETASPDASEVIASPVVDVEAEATPAPPEGTVVEDQAVIDEVTAGIENFFNCFNNEDYASAVALLTANALMTDFGSDNPYDVIAEFEFFGALVDFTLTSVDNVQMLDDGRLIADVTYLMQNQPIAERNVLVEEDGYWKLDESYELPDPGTDLDSVAVGVQVSGPEDEYSFTLARETITVQPAVILHGLNAGTEDHEIAVLTLPEGFNLEELFMGPPPEGLTFHGAIELAPGEEGDLVLEGLEPGVYTLVCFFETEEGVPHAAEGMVAELTIEAAA